jgi:hypothetical protein
LVAIKEQLNENLEALQGFISAHPELGEAQWLLANNILFKKYAGDAILRSAEYF